MKIIVLSPFPYFAKVSHGGGMMSWEQLQMMAPEHELHFLGFVTRESEAEQALARADLGGLCASVQMLPLDLSRNAVWRAKLACVLRFQPIDAVLFQSTAMRAALAALQARVQPDLVLLQFPQMAQYVGDCGNAATALDIQDLFSVSAFRKFRAQTAPLKKIHMFFNWLSWLFYEMRYYPAFDALATITEQDRVGLGIFSPGLKVQVIGPSITLDDTVAPPAQADTIGFIGSFSHSPNVDAVSYFIAQIWPLVRRARPDARFLVAGANAPPELLGLAGDGVEFVGFVDDANVFMRSVAAIAVPLLSGGGIKIKTLHAMACARPIVSTSIGAEETGIVDGEHAFIADRPELFARQLLALLNDPQAAAQLGARARTLVQRQFSWDAKVASIGRLLEQARSQRRARQAAQAPSALV